jgi:LysM repeat protein
MATLSGDKKSVTVVKGDTLSEIALTYKDYISGSTNEARINTLVKLNNLKNPDLIVVGQVLKLSGTAKTEATNNSSKAVIDVFGLQSNTDRTVYATWTWSKDHTENYEVVWQYDTGDSVWFIGSDSTEKDKQSVYNAPSNAKRVRVKIKPISKKYKSGENEVSYWTASWSTYMTYNFSSNPPIKPSAPTVKIDKYKITATLDNLDLNATGIQFQVVKDNKTVFKTGNATITTGHVSYSCTVNAGSEYKVRCRSYKGKVYSAWSEYSSNLSTIPATPKGITTCKANSETSVYLAWAAVNTATSYDIEYTTKKEYFNGSDKTTTTTGIEFTHYEKTGLESGEEYFFRIRAVNESGHSAWSGIKSVVIGEDPAAPTTWSSSTTVITGEPLNLYWVHNATDGSKETYAELEMYINGKKETRTIKNTSTDDDDEQQTRVYSINTSTYVEGTIIEWRVRTAGITKAYGEWSIQRTIDIYAPPTLELAVTDINANPVETLETFPLYVSALAGPNTQAPIGYHLTITAKESYETVDNIGNVKMVKTGEQVYSKHFDTSEQLLVEISANHVNLDNNISYTVTCLVSMDSGLTAEASVDFDVAWTDDEAWPDAQIAIDKEILAAYIRPYCLNRDVTLSVYRREFDGSFTELVTGVDSDSNTFITDPHPALDYARYRVIAIAKDTGAVSFYDIPGIPVEEKAIIIQWDEEWSYLDASGEDETEQPPWAGSLLKLPYNIDVADKYSNDVSLVKYIGRSHPVSYHGTQIGETSAWNVEIPSTDTETLYALRRLAIWMGNAYVREPSGSGYWATVSVSFNQTHREVTIPVSLSITRVEGGL